MGKVDRLVMVVLSVVLWMINGQINIVLITIIYAVGLVLVS